MSIKGIFSSCIMLLTLECSVGAQESASVFNFLGLPSSTRVVALGGRNISIVEDDAFLGFHNPALLGSVSDKTAALGFMTYMSGVKVGTANYVQAQGERGTWAVGAQYVGYGNIKETDIEGHVLGESSAMDMAFSGSYCYALSNYWVGGATGKFLYSNYVGFSSVAMCFDVGVNYYNAEKDFSFSFVAANLGVQFKPFGDVRESLPIQLDMGLSKGLGSFPARVSLTLQDLTHWSSSYYYNAGDEVSGFQVLMNHINLGVEVMPMNGKLWAALGYNFRRANELTAGGASHAAGLTLGAGVNLKKMKFGFAYAKYHVGAPTLSFNLAYSFGK